MQFTFDLFHLIAGGLFLVGTTILIMTIIFGDYILGHLLTPAMNREKGLGVFSGLCFGFRNQMRFIWQAFIFWVIGAGLFFLLVPVMETITTKILIGAIGVALMSEVIWSYPRFWKVSLKEPKPKKNTPAEQGGRDA